MDFCISVAQRDNGNRFKVYFPMLNQYKTPKETYDANVREINNAHTVIALVESKDVGTAYELGIAMALKKNIILMAYDEDAFKRKTNIMLAFCTNICTTVDQLKFILRGMPFKTIPMENSWEGKE
jgi:nucleoside 2-deoxyribosyltransferase